MRKDGTVALGYIPGQGNSSLPICRPDLNPNLVWVYVDARQDYLEGRVYLLGAKVVACANGVPVGERTFVRMTAGPPDSSAKERQLFVDWTRELLKAVVGLASSGAPLGEKKSAPIHVVFFDRYDQRVLLEGLARSFPAVLKQTPPLYDFLTQLAAFDSPIATFLSEELRATKNLPMTCPSLQSVSTWLKFKWHEPHDFRTAFKRGLFDHVGKLDIDGQSEWVTRRARFSSSIPLEYAYVAWGRVPAPRPGRGDEFKAYRGATIDLLQAFQVRRLEAIEHVACDIQGNKNTQKTPFVLPDLAGFTDSAISLAQALHEFVTIERLVELADWKTIRHAPPEQRVLMGQCFIVRYLESDQTPEIAEKNRDNARRESIRETYLAAHEAANPGAKFQPTKEQRAEFKWSAEGMVVRLRIDCSGVDCDLTEALLLSTFKDDERLVLKPRWEVDSRLPLADQKEFTPTPKQMLYAPRAKLVRLEATTKDEAGRVTEAFAEVELLESRGGKATTPYVFFAFARPLEEGEQYTIDGCPNNWYGYFCHTIVEGVRAGRPNVLYDRLLAPASAGSPGSVGQHQFLAGLDAFHAAGHLHGFEPGKRAFIGEHATTSILLVQGPPGTGKSYSTAFAVFARMQDALHAGRPFRAFLTCKTHSATDVLLRNVLEVRAKLSDLRTADPILFRLYFDARLLDAPLFRVAPKEPPPAGVVALFSDEEPDDDALPPPDFDEHEWAIVAATPGGTRKLLKAWWPRDLFGHELCDLLVLDEASQMNLPEALMAALPLAAKAPVIVVGDHRQMPPIVKHDWAGEARRTFQQYQVYESLFDLLREQGQPMIRFEESFRLHASMAEFLRREIYRHDGIAYHSKRRDLLAAREVDDPFTRAVLDPEYPLVVVTHAEASSQLRNPFEQILLDPVLRFLASQAGHGLDPTDGLGVVVPHRAQRAALQQAFPELNIIDPRTGLPSRSAIDTVERFQGGERTVVIVSATESDPAYILASAGFLLDPRRLTVAVSRAKRKLVLVAAKSVFALFSPDAETFENAQLWKNLLRRTCTTRLWDGERAGQAVTVWGGRAEQGN